MPNPAQKCSNCYWADHRTRGGTTYLKCFVEPPRPSQQERLETMLWPVVHPDDYCRQWSTGGEIPGVLTGPKGDKGDTGATGAASTVQGPAGYGYDAATATYRDRITTTNAVTTVLRSVPIPVNARTWMDAVVQFRDATNIVGGYLWLTIGCGRASGLPILFGTVDVLESHNLAGPSSTLVVNTLTNSIDLTVTGKAATSISWTARTMVDWG